MLPVRQRFIRSSIIFCSVSFFQLRAVTSALDVDVDAEFESLLADIAAEERAAAAKSANVTVAAPAPAAAQQPESAAATTASSAPATTKTKTLVNTTQ